MTPWLKNHFQSDDMPADDIAIAAYDAALNVVSNPEKFPHADFATLNRLIDELETDAEFSRLEMRRYAIR